MATVTVRGAASVAATPDEAGVAIELSDLRDTPEEAYARVGERSDALTQLLDELEVDRAQRSSGGISVRPHVEYVEGGSNTVATGQRRGRRFGWRTPG